MKKLNLLLLIILFLFSLSSCKKEKEEEIELEKYTVKFVDFNGNQLGTKKVEEGKKISKPKYTVEGYDTIHWTYNGKIWDFNTDVVKRNMTLIQVAKKHTHQYIDGECSCGYKSPVNPLLDLSLDELRNLSANVTFWHAMGQKNQVVIDEIIKVFNQYYPNIKVTHASQGSYSDLRDKIIKGIAIGEKPTIAQVYPDHVSIYLEGNSNDRYLGVRALDDFINHPTYGLTISQLKDFVPSYLNECRQFDYEGTFYSLPFTSSTEVLYINASWFEQNGLLAKYNLGHIAIENGKEVFKANEGAHLSWEDIEEIGQYFINTAEYKALDAIEKLNNYALSYDSEGNLFIALTKQWGGEYTKLTGENQGEFLFNNAYSKAAIQWYLNAYKAGYFVTASAWGDPDAYTSDRFINQQVKMVIASSAGASYNNPQDKFVLGVLPYPQREATYATGQNQYVVLNSTDLSLFHSETSEEELAGWLFIKFLTTWTEGLEDEKQPTFMWCDGTGYCPILSSLRNSEKYDLILRGYDKNGVYVGQKLEDIAALVGWEQRNNYYIAPSFLGSSTCHDVVEELIEYIMYGGSTISEAYERAVEKLQ